MKGCRPANPPVKGTPVQRIIRAADAAMDYTLFLAILGAGTFLLQQVWG